MCIRDSAHLLGEARGTAQILTLAPELPGALDLIFAARKAGLIVSLGHTDATYEQAQAAIEAGASLVNDISASLWPVAAAARVGWVAMHMRGEPATMQHDIHYRDVVADVREFLRARVGQAEAAGVDEIWIDPGIGFGKTAEHNLALLHHLDALTSIGRPVVVGTSRKSFIGSLAPSADGAPAPVDDRLEGSLATAVWAMLRGAAMVRVHDVGPTRQAARLVDAARASAPLGAAR